MEATMEYRKVLDLIAEELGKAEEKFPGFPEDPIHAAAVVMEEAGELVRASLQETYAYGNNMQEEAIQTAAMAIRFLLNIEKMKKRPSVQV